MYEGSMYGAGLAVFAVWGFVISHARDSRIELNPKKLADTLGGTVEDINRAIEYLSRPDPQSRHRDHEGRRLVQDGQFQYFLPSWSDYQRVKNEDDRREYNRVKQQEYRSKNRRQNKPLAGENKFLKMEANGEDVSREPGNQIPLPSPATTPEEPEAK